MGFTPAPQRNKIKLNLLDTSLCLITTISHLKLSYYNDISTCVIPDLPLFCLIKFINTFESIQSNNESKLLESIVYHDNKEDINKIRYPNIFDNNFKTDNLSLLSKLKKFDCLSIVINNEINNIIEYYNNTNNASDIIDINNIYLYIINYDDVKSELLRTTLNMDEINSLFKIKLYQYNDSDYYGNILLLNNNTNRFFVNSCKLIKNFNKNNFINYLSIKSTYDIEILNIFDKFFKNNEHMNEQLLEKIKSLCREINNKLYFKNKDLNLSETDIQKNIQTSILKLRSKITNSKNICELKYYITDFYSKELTSKKDTSCICEDHINNLDEFMKENSFKNLKFTLKTYILVRYTNKNLITKNIDTENITDDTEYDNI
jgi:hypothetical protein